MRKMENWQTIFEKRLITADHAISLLKSGGHVSVSSGCGEPLTLIEALLKQAPRFKNLHLYNMAVGSSCPYTAPAYRENFRLISVLPEASMRTKIQAGTVEYLPVRLSLFPEYLASLPLDAALIQITPPDRHGFCSLGLSVDYTKPAAMAARLVIAEINETAPRTLGNSFIHVSQVDYFVKAEKPVLELAEAPNTSVERTIAEQVVKLIPDKATVQLGIGSLAGAIARQLKSKNELGIHTGIFTDAFMELVESGAVTNRHKGTDTYNSVFTQVMGSRKLYAYVDDNPGLAIRTCDYTHNFEVIQRLRNFRAVNSAVEVDIFGQVNAESIKGEQLSGTGGQLDFMHAACQGKDSFSIVAIPSTASGGKVSRIVPRLSSGTVVTTPRVDVDYVVTEYGVAELRHKTLKQRAEALIAVAHPDFRTELRQ